MRLIYIFILISTILFSCSPAKRFNRLVKKHPHLVQTDTIIRYDTVKVLVPKVEHDSIFITKPIDTIILEKERLRVQVIRKYDTLEVSGKCDTVTVTKIREVKVPVKYYDSNTFNWKKTLFWLIIGLVLYIVIRNYIKQSKL